VQEGPQHITVDGEPAAVVLSEADYEFLRKRPERFIDFIRNSPLKGVELDLTRDGSVSCKVSL
jgi:prevent-host-death family protein